MSDDKNLIVKSRDLAEIIRREDSAALSEFLKDPPAVIAGALIEGFSHGPSALAGPLVRIGVSALKGRALQQFAKEIGDLREKGKLADDFAEKKYGFQTWVELLQIIDEDTPDEDRLEALKAMFYSANKVKAAEGEQILGYQLFQIAKRLSSNELLVLKAVYGMNKQGKFVSGQIGFREWTKIVSEDMGHRVAALVEHADRILTENQLLTERTLSGAGVQSHGGRLTDLGISFCHNIERYQIDKKS